MKHTLYETYPIKKLDKMSDCAFKGYDEIIAELKRYEGIITIDCYPGVDEAELLLALKDLSFERIIHTIDYCIPSEEMDQKLADNMTDDRVFGIMSDSQLKDYFDLDRVEGLNKELSVAKENKILIYGVGASLIHKGDINIYADISRWEIQLRYRKGMSNWNSKNGDAPILSKYKRGFFAEWRFADRHKKKLIQTIDYLIDMNRTNDPSMIKGDTLRFALDKISREPFRTVPYFDPGVWGGHWMEKVCGLPENGSNYAWSFDGVPEENSIAFQIDDTIIEIPAMDLTLYKPEVLLGKRVYEQFGTEFPIRFDFLDTMGGGNLSLQVHPLKKYIKEQFGMSYTQDESYYFLDAGEDACVYLGVKTGINKEEMKEELLRAEEGSYHFDAERFVNKIPVKKHDHILIPSGTIHCSGANGMVLEISATPYIFTFKLWDWDRIGLDGKKRPIHLNHGFKNIIWDRDTEWVMENLIHQEKEIQKKEEVLLEHTGLHPLEFIDTYRYTFTNKIALIEDGSVHMLNLVEGESAIIESIDNRFEPFTVHYAETFIIPAGAGACTIRPQNTNGISALKLILATIRKSYFDIN